MSVSKEALEAVLRAQYEGARKRMDRLARDPKELEETRRYSTSSGPARNKLLLGRIPGVVIECQLLEKIHTIEAVTASLEQETGLRFRIGRKSELAKQPNLPISSETIRQDPI